MATFILGENGELATTNLSFDEISKILSARADEKNAENAKNAKTNENPKGCDLTKKLVETIDEFSLCMLKHIGIGMACMKAGLEPMLIHKSFLRYSLKAGKSLTEVFDELESAEIEKSCEMLAKILGL